MFFFCGHEETNSLIFLKNDLSEVSLQIFEVFLLWVRLQSLWSFCCNWGDQVVWYANVCEAHANETCVTVDWLCVIAVILKHWTKRRETRLIFIEVLYVEKLLLTDALSW